MRIRVGVGCVAAVVSAWSLAWATTTAGRLDPAFGVDGVQTVAQPMTDVRDAAIDAQDRLVSVGYASRAVGGVTVARWVVQRFTTTGGLDATFAAGGVYEMEGVTSADRADAVAVAPDGRILVGGYRSWASGGKRPSTQIAGALLCLSANGTVDWRVDLPGYPFVNDLVIVPVGSGYEIVVAKRDDVTTTVSSGGKGKGTSTTSEAIALLRFNASGTLLSTTYDEVSTTHSDVPIVVRQDGLGRLVVGFRQTGTGATRWGIARYLATGSLDTTFGTNGWDPLESTCRHASLSIL